MTAHERTKQLIKQGFGVATAMLCPTTGNPFLIVAANVDDLEAILVIRCQYEPEQFDRTKFKRVKIHQLQP